MPPMSATPTKIRSENNERYRSLAVLRAECPRAARGRVSTIRSAATMSTTAPYTDRTTKMPRQSVTRSSCEPITGARIGASPLTKARRDSILTSG